MGTNKKEEETKYFTVRVKSGDSGAYYEYRPRKGGKIITFTRTPMVYTEKTLPEIVNRKPYYFEVEEITKDRADAIRNADAIPEPDEKKPEGEGKKE